MLRHKFRAYLRPGPYSSLRDGPGFVPGPVRLVFKPWPALQPQAESQAALPTSLPGSGYGGVVYVSTVYTLTPPSLYPAHKVYPRFREFPDEMAFPRSIMQIYAIALWASTTGS